MNDTEIYPFLDQNQIGYERIDHPAVYTCEQADLYLSTAPGARTKNLFLNDEKETGYFLLTVHEKKKVDFKNFSRQVGRGKLRFASAEKMIELLGIAPGSVTILALINDPAHKVKFLLDRDLAGMESFQCHPLVNTATLIIPRVGLERFFQLSGHEVNIVDVPGQYTE